MLSSRCSLSRCFFCSFSRVFRAVEKSVRARVLMRIFVTCPFPPTPNEMLSRRTTKAQQKKTVSSRRERVSLSVVLFLVRFRVSLSVLFPFSSRKAFVVVPLLKDLVAKRERFAVKLFQIRNSYTELGIIRTSAEPTARHPMHRLPTFRALLVQRY